jgi:hypothetical protein
MMRWIIHAFVEIIDEIHRAVTSPFLIRLIAVVVMEYCIIQEGRMYLVGFTVQHSLNERIRMLEIVHATLVVRIGGLISGEEMLHWLIRHRGGKQ